LCSGWLRRSMGTSAVHGPPPPYESVIMSDAVGAQSWLYSDHRVNVKISVIRNESRRSNYVAGCIPWQEHGTGGEPCGAYLHNRMP
jgi:hypothetical protein